MRADIMKWCAGHMTARDAVLLVLTSDREISSREESLSKGKGRSMANLREYNSKVDHKVLYRLIEEGLIEQLSFKFRLANRRVTL